MVADGTLLKSRFSINPYIFNQSDVIPLPTHLKHFNH